MSGDWAPVLRMPAVAPKESAPVVVPPQVVVMPADPVPRPKRWRFVPHRGQDNLIDEIIATPEY